MFKQDPNLANYQNQWGDTPVHLAAAKGSKESIALIVKFSCADVNKTNKYNPFSLIFLSCSTLDLFFDY
jgi:ankyrin repeat protein